jgi:membrane protein EpsK
MNKQIIKNILANTSNFIINLGIGLSLTPFLINRLGISAYGLIPLAMFIASYIGVLTQSLTASVNRYLINAIQESDNHESNVVFNTALISILIVITFLILTLGWPILHIEYFISVPIGLSFDAVILFFSIFIGVLISLLSSVFSVSMYTYNRIDLMQVISIFKNVTRFFIVLAFFYYENISITAFGYAVVISELLSLVAYVIYWKRKTPQLFINFSNFSIDMLKKLSSISNWLILDQMGTIILSKSDLLLVNRNYGSIISGKYSVITQFSDLLRSMASLIGGVLGPVMMILHTQKNEKKMVEFTIFFMKLMSLLIAIPIILLCIFSKEIIELWIGNTYTDLYLLIWIAIFPLIINLGTIPLFSINIALNKVKIPSLSNICFGLLGLAVSLLLVKFTELGFYAIAIGFIFSTSLKNSFFTPIYAAHILRIKKSTFFIVHIYTFLFAVTFCLVCYCVKIILQPVGIDVIYVCIALAFVGLLILFFYLGKNIRSEFISYFKNKIMGAK